jgi:glycerol-3-phosphate dehydrogenase
MSRAAVLGSGSWGTAFAKVLADAGTDVTMWARREELAASITDDHENKDYLSGIELPSSIRATSDPVRALDGADIVVLAVPSQSLRANLGAWTDSIPPHATLLSLAKGIETGTLMPGRVPVRAESCAPHSRGTARRDRHRVLRLPACPRDSEVLRHRIFQAVHQQ